MDPVRAITPLLARSGLLMQTGSYFSLAALVVLGTVIDNFPFELRLLLTFVLSLFINPLTSPIWRFAYVLINLITSLFAITAIGPITSFFLLSYENGEKESRLLEGVAPYLEKMENAAVDACSTPTGINSPVSGIVDFLSTTIFSGFIHNIKKAFEDCDGDTMLPHTYFTFIRGNGVSNLIREDTDFPKIPVEKAIEIEERVVGTRKFMYTMLLGFALLISFGSYNALPIMIGALLFYSCGKGVAIYRSSNPTRASIPDGIYSGNWKVCGTNHHLGIGVCYNGVLHVPYHVVKNSAIVLYGQTLYPHYVSPMEDLVTYCGNPQFHTVNMNDQLLVNLESGVRQTYATRAFSTEKGFTFGAFTNPGDSGSPVWRATDDGDLQLVGLAGRWVKLQGKTVEYSVRDPYIVTDPQPDVKNIPQVESQRQWTGLTQMVSHPGSGKTRNVIPKLIRYHMLAQREARKSVRLVVLGPTRVVCRELYSALQRDFGGLVSLHIKGSGCQTFCPISIMAHHTFWEMYEREEPRITNLTGLILDEAHNDDVTTILIKKLSRELSKTIPVAWLTATMSDTHYDDGSNYPIEDVKIETSDLVPKILEEAPGKNVGVFLPTIKQITDLKKELTEKLPGHLIVQLSRDTYQQVSHAKVLEKDEPKIVLMTNIAEMGLNADLDTIIDSSKEFKYLSIGENIVGVTKKIGRSSQVQRRGRVGRRKNGRYLYCEEPDADDDRKTSSEYDAELLSAGTPYADPDNVETPLSKNQRLIALTKDLPPRYVRTFFHTNGRPLTGQHLREALTEWTSGDEQSSCRERKCACHVNALWHDARVHKHLVNLLTDHHKSPTMTPVMAWF